MGRLIKTFTDGSRLEFDRGKFDDWCIYLSRPGQPRYAPQDIQYFADLQALATRHPAPALYADFVAIFDVTGKQVEDRVLGLIADRAQAYGADELDTQIIFTILYAGMIAEMNKAKTRLGKRIKRLGVYQILVEGLPAPHAATFSKGQPWRAIAAECQKRGF